MDSEQFFISLFDSKKIGDDGAILGDFIYSSDMFFEDVHFKREWMSLYQIARKSMLVNISDAVAMGAKVCYGLLNIQLPRDLSNLELEELSKGFLESAREFDFEIVGGDTIGGDKLNITITLISKSENPLTRFGLKSGDFLAFTGELGESLRDLNRLFAGAKIESSSKFLEPKLRVDFMREARAYLTAGMDISDGLFCDTNKLLDANSLGLKLSREISRDVGLSGEEYELLISFSPKNLEKLLAVSRETSTPITVFGEVTKDSFRFECGSHHF